MDPEIKHQLDRIERKVDYSNLLIEEKHKSLVRRVALLEKAGGGFLGIFITAVVGWIFFRDR